MSDCSSNMADTHIRYFKHCERAEANNSRQLRRIFLETCIALLQSAKANVISSMSSRSTDLLSKHVPHHAGLVKPDDHQEEDGQRNQVTGLSTVPLLGRCVSKSEGRLDCANGACLRGHERNDEDERDIVATRLVSSCNASKSLGRHPELVCHSRGDGSEKRTGCIRGTCLVLGSCIC